jgi:DNA-binding NarL/FixJ family response regulator
MGARRVRDESVAMHTATPTLVYIVEDSPAIRARLTEMLSRIDTVTVVGEAASAREAVTAILRLRPHSVLLDLNLLGASGMEVLRAVHARAPEIEFVVLTNKAEPQYRRACAAAGARYFLDKTREFERVPDVIAEIAALRH